MPVNRGPGADPLGGRLYKIVAFLSRWQLHALMRDAGRERRFRLFFAASMGAVALATITAASVITKLPLLFPPLAPSAFILFTTPLSPAAAPRSILLGHTLAVASGVAALALTQLLIPGAGLDDPEVMNPARGLAIFLAMGLATTVLKLSRSNHPPATASALLAAMGLFEGLYEALALVTAASLLVFEAWVMLRVIGGIPYPNWKHEPRVARHHGKLAGLWDRPDAGRVRNRPKRKSPETHEDLPAGELDRILNTITESSDETVGSPS